MTEPGQRSERKHPYAIAGLSLLLFLSGAIIGGSCVGLYGRFALQRLIIRTKDPFAEAVLYSLNQELTLTQDQQTRAREAITGFARDFRILTVRSRPEARESWDQAVRKIRDSLSAEQAQQLDRMNLAFLRSTWVAPFAQIFRELALDPEQIRRCDQVLARNFSQAFAISRSLKSLPEALLQLSLPELRQVLTERQQRLFDQLTTSSQSPQTGPVTLPTRQPGE